MSLQDIWNNASQWLFIFSVIALTFLIFGCKQIKSIFYKKHPEEIDKLTETQFFEQFESVMPENILDKNKRWQELIDKAWKLRDFEIDLYWKRANYFWLFQIPAFTGFFAINKTVDDVTKKPIEIFVVICLGIVFSSAWLLINKGSKAWQRHWEEYIDMIERKYYGPLYQTVSSDRTYSVSKINEIVSASFIVAWVLFAITYLQQGGFLHMTFKLSDLNSTIAFSILFTALAHISMIWGYGRGYFKDRPITMYRRRHHYVNPK